MEETRKSKLAQEGILKLALDGTISSEAHTKLKQTLIDEETAKVEQMIKQIQRRPKPGPSKVSTFNDACQFDWMLIAL